MQVEDLLSRGIPQPLIDAWKSDGIDKLTSCQEAVFTHDPLWSGRNIIVVAPTSAGKTFVGEVLATRAAYHLNKAILLVPFKAIAEEKYAEFRERYLNAGISVAISDGDHTAFDRDIRKGDFALAIIVFEKLAQLLIQAPGILANCRLVVIDEIQLIADANRGAALEMLLTHILQLQPSPQIIGLSATLDDLGGLDTWLDADVINSSQRPVPLWESIVSSNGPTELINVESDNRRPGPETTLVTVPSTLASPGSPMDLAYRVLAAEGFDKRFLLFRTRVDDTILTAQQLAFVLPTEPVSGDVRERIANLEDTPTRAFLEQWIDRRIAYHNAGLSLEERRLIEQFFNEGVLRYLVATSTLAAGVNTPADVVIVVDYRRWDQRVRSRLPIPVGEYKNSVGRAGRFRIASEGKSYLITSNQSETPLLKNRYIYGRPEPLRSSIPGAPDPAALILTVIARGLINTQQGVREAFASSFAYNFYFDNEDEQDDFLTTIMESLVDLLASELVKEESGQLLVTPLGDVAAASGLTIQSFNDLTAIVLANNLTESTVWEILGLLCTFDEFASLRPFDSEERETLLHEWINGLSVTQISDRHSGQYTVGHGNVRAIGSTAAWFLRTSAQICTLPEYQDGLGQMATPFEDLANRCLFGVPAEIVDVAKLNVLRRSDAIRLVDNATGMQFTSFHQILDAPLGDFVGILSPQMAERLKDAIIASIGDSLGRRRAGHLARAEHLPILRPLVEQVYDVEGNEFERALEDLFNSGPIRLGAMRFTRQRTGQPDLEITGSKGTIVIQATASIDGQKPISWNKARDVTSSVGYSGQASNFVVIGRPEFHDVAVGNANEMAERGDQNLLLISLPELMELYLREAEGTLSSGYLVGVLESARGHYVCSQREA